MNVRNPGFLLLILIVLGSVPRSEIAAQERLDILTSNPLLKGKTQPVFHARQGVLSLPFFDDFYPVDVYPDPALWEEDLVYVNATFPIGPPTIGVATFDGLNSNGDAYSIVSDDHGIADQLTSRAIDLSSLTNEDDVYLSFYYQPGGLGDEPDYDPGDVQNQDQLMVEFRDSSGKWDTLWVRNGEFLKPFEQVFIHVRNTHLHQSFQFRFKAIGRLTGSFDHWQVDYVRLDENRDPAIEMNIAEMAYQYWPSPLLTPYYVMPYNQFDSTYVADTHSVFIRNNFIQVTTDIIDFYVARELSTGTILNSFAGASRDIGPLISLEEEYTAFDIPEDVNEDTVTIRVNYSFLVSAEDTSNTVSNRNNKVVKDQVFSNFFAYDDASAEKAYILEVRPGDAIFGRVALRHKASTADTLRAVKLQLVNFNEDLGNVNFALMIWKTIESDSTEGELLYRQDFIRVDDLLSGDSVNSINGFVYVPILPEYILNEEDFLLVDGEFFIGYEVGINVTLPIGFDLNTDGSKFHFVNLGQGWSPTQFAGSLMMNPILGRGLPERFVVSTNDHILESLGFEMYPNPVVNHLSLKSSVQNGFIEVIDLVGRTILEKNFTLNDRLDVRSLNPGVYILRLTDKDKGISGSSRFIRP